MIKYYRNLKKLVAYRRLLQQDGSENYHVSFITDKAFLRSAKRLHADVYLARNFINQDAVNHYGYMGKRHDPYQEHSEYFAVFHKSHGSLEMIATARQINAQAQHGHNSFPTFAHLELFPDKRDYIAGLDASTCVEISALAKKRGYSSFAALLLYRQMWQYSLRQNHRVWLMACDEVVYRQLKVLFGPALVQVGPKSYYMGSWVVPAVLEVRSALDQLSENKRSLNPVRRSFTRDLIAFFNRGLPAAKSIPIMEAELEPVPIKS